MPFLLAFHDVNLGLYWTDALYFWMTSNCGDYFELQTEDNCGCLQLRVERRSNWAANLTPSNQESHLQTFSVDRTQHVASTRHRLPFFTPSGLAIWVLPITSPTSSRSAPSPPNTHQYSKKPSSCSIIARKISLTWICHGFCESPSGLFDDHPPGGGGGGGVETSLFQRQEHVHSANAMTSSLCLSLPNCN